MTPFSSRKVHKQDSVRDFFASRVSKIGGNSVIPSSWSVDQAVHGIQQANTLMMLRLQFARQLGHGFAECVGNWLRRLTFEILIVVVVHMLLAEITLNKRTLHVFLVSCDRRDAVEEDVGILLSLWSVKALHHQPCLRLIIILECHNPTHFHQNDSLTRCRLYHRVLDKCVEFLVLLLLASSRLCSADNVDMHVVT